MTLQKGDVVRYVSGQFRRLTKGNLYTVDAYYPDTGIFYTKDDQGTPRGFIFPYCKFGLWKVINNDK